MGARTTSGTPRRSPSVIARSGVSRRASSRCATAQTQRVAVGRVRRTTGRSASCVASSLDAPVWAAPAFGIELSLGVDGLGAGRAAGRVGAPAAAAHPSPAVTRYQPLPTTPASEFDLALLVPDGVRGEQVEARDASACPANCSNASNCSIAMLAREWSLDIEASRGG